MNCNLTSAIALALLLTTGPVLAIAAGQGHGDHSGHGHAAMDHADEGKSEETPKDDAAVIAEQLPTYPMSVCPVSGEKLGGMGEPANHVHEGRLVRFCCSMCEGQFSEEPAAYLAKIDEAVIREQLPTYPLGVCPVSGQKLGSMGEPYDHVHGTRVVRFCCGGCIDSFNEDPAAHLGKIDAAAALNASKTR